jgi:hypothetical protein
MKATALPAMLVLVFHVALLNSARGGTWNDHFYQATLASDWTGNRTLLCKRMAIAARRFIGATAPILFIIAPLRSGPVPLSFRA